MSRGFENLDSAGPYLSLHRFLPVGVLGGVGGHDRAGVLDNFAILELELPLDARLDLPGGDQFGFALLDDLLCGMGKWEREENKWLLYNRH